MGNGNQQNYQRNHGHHVPVYRHFPKRQRSRSPSRSMGGSSWSKSSGSMVPNGPANTNNGMNSSANGTRRLGPPYPRSRQPQFQFQPEKSPENEEDQLWPVLIDVPVNDWIFELEDLEEKTPSRLHKKMVSYENELIFRGKCVQRIIEFATSVKLSRRAVIAASVFINRFYMFNDFYSLEYKLVVATCAFLASKAEESLKNIRQIATNLAMMYKPGTPVEELESLVWKNVDSIKAVENKVLRDLRFDLSVLMPSDVYESALKFEKLQGFFELNKIEISQSKFNLFLKQFNTLSDCIIICPVHLLYNSYEIAATCFFVTCIARKHRVPSGFLTSTFGVGLPKITQVIKYLKETIEFLKTTDIRVPGDVRVLSIDCSIDALSAFVDNVSKTDLEVGENEHKKADKNGAGKGAVFETLESLPLTPSGGAPGPATAPSLDPKLKLANKPTAGLGVSVVAKPAEVQIPAASAPAAADEKTAQFIDEKKSESDALDY